ncbi:MAG TPA: EAL domain-containing protein, partial [Acidimicrobiales bacterium]|nr:EAL domain-containing protein [Acidimicrobiales bacterium]
LLVLLRLTSVTRQQALLATNEHLLRDTGERLLTTADVEGMYSVALEAVAGLAGPLTAAVLVSEQSADGAVVAKARPHTLEQSAIRIDHVSASDGRARVTLPEGHAAFLGLQGLAWSAFSLGESAGTRRQLVVGLRRPLSSDAMAVLESIAVLVGLAVERIELARLVHERRSEARFRALVQNASDLILIARPDGRLVAETPSVSTVLGYEGDALAGLSITSLLEPEDVTRALALLQSMLAGHSSSPQRTEWRVRHAEGRTLVMEVVANDLLANRDVAGIALTMRDVTERKRLEDELRHRAFHDSLTNLANRALFNDRVQNAMNRSLRQHTSVAVLLLDLDDFKLVNDTFGHAAGDGLLIEIGKRLSDVLRHGDTAARLGGDEFAVCVEFDDTRSDDATTLAQRILESFSVPIELEGIELMASATIGVAVDSATGSDAGELLRQADLALYAAKEAGKRTYRFYEPGLHAAALSRLERRNALEAALSPSQFVVHYQPIVDLRDGHVSAVEALVRWQHPDRGLLPPSEFVDIAEETGLIIELGEWVLDQACQDLTRLRLVPGSHDGLRMSVNVSPRQLRQDGFVVMVDDVLARNAVWPGELILEITESVLLDGDDGVMACLEDLDSRGIALALDDFGTGYSSLSYLHQFPLRTIKIDRSFVQEMGSPNGEALVDSIVSMGRSLGLLQVAEGIEHPAQAAALTRLGCPYGQGLLFAPALPVEELMPIIGRRLLPAPDRAVLHLPS